MTDNITNPSGADMPDSTMIPVLEQKVAEQPENSSSHYNLGLALASVGEWDRSLAEFRAASAETPGRST